MSALAFGVAGEIRAVVGRSWGGDEHVVFVMGFRMVVWISVFLERILGEKGSKWRLQVPRTSERKKVLILDSYNPSRSQHECLCGKEIFSWKFGSSFRALCGLVH